MNKKNGKIVNVYTKHYFILLLLIVFRYLDALYQKSKFLQTAIPVPLLAWLFDLLLVYAIIDVIIIPILHYKMLKNVKAFSLRSSDEINKEIFKVQHVIKKIKDDTEKESYKELQNYLDKKQTRFYSDEDKKEIENQLVQYYKKESNKIIKHYSVKAAFLATLNRNQFIDGLFLFIAQYKMAMELIFLHGYKPSPVFNSCCLIWSFRISIFGGIFFQPTADFIGKNVGKFITTMKPEFIGKVALSGFVSNLSSIGSEMTASASTIYFSGKIISNRLLGYQDEGIVSELENEQKQIEEKNN